MSGEKSIVTLEPRDVLLDIDLGGKNTVGRSDIDILERAGMGHPHPECVVERDNEWCEAC